MDIAQGSRGGGSGADDGAESETEWTEHHLEFANNNITIFKLPKRYVDVQKISSGAYGQVVSAVDSHTGR